MDSLVECKVLSLTSNDYRCLCKHSDFFDSQKRFDNMCDDDTVNVKIISPRRDVDLDFVSRVLALIAKPVDDISVLLSFNCESLLLCMDYFQMINLFKRLAKLLIQDVNFVKSHLLMFLHAITATFGNVHPFMDFMVKNIHFLNVHFPLTVTSYKFCCLMSNVSRRRMIRDKLRMTKRVQDFNTYPHIECPYCERKVLFKPLGDYQFDSVQLTPCCGSPVHKTCIDKYLTEKFCILCDIPLERVGVDKTKPCYDLELTLHHCLHRVWSKDANDVPRAVKLQNIFKR